jgi:succinate dehydrogenase/fumarate reductase flavoprotein subunit
MGETTTAWDQVVDVVIAGSGAAALAAAIAAGDGGAEVLVIEKADQLGGVSAWSGGGIWIPCNDHMRSAGIDDSREEALEYILTLVGERVPDPALVERFVDAGPEAIRFLEAHSALRVHPDLVVTDYYPGPGFEHGRSLVPDGIDGKAVIGEWWNKVRDSPHYAPLSDEELIEERTFSFHDDRTGRDSARMKPDFRKLVDERLASGIRFFGPALITGLMRGALDASVMFRLSTAVDRLVVDDGRVVGVIALNEDQELGIGARRGVVLATGGFEWNEDFVKAFLGVPDVFPLSPSTNTGDGLRVGLEIGAAVGNMTNPCSMPANWDGRRELEGKRFGTVARSRNDPGVVIVNRIGKRFTNEGICYMDAAKMFRIYDPYAAGYPNTTPVWQVFDQRTRENLLGLEPGPAPDWVHEAPTIAELAVKMGVDPDVLTDEIGRWNSYVAARKDPDFHRGEIWREGAMIGGPSPEKNMKAIENPSFFAMPLYNGIASTLGGLLTDTNARVRSLRGDVIDGLYAVGAVAAWAFGDHVSRAGRDARPEHHVRLPRWSPRRSESRARRRGDRRDTRLIAQFALQVKRPQFP